MHNILTFVAFGWLVFTGTLHFIIDVFSQYLRKKRIPGPETTLYYGFNTSFALGQILFGLTCLYYSPSVLARAPVAALSLAAATGWLAISLAFMTYREPKVNAAIVAVLILAALSTV